MRRKLKAFSSLVVAVALLFTLVPHVSASASTVPNSISPDTVVTTSNVYQVLKSLGIDTSKVKTSNLKTKTTKTYTVQDLKNAIQRNNKETSNINSNCNPARKINVISNLKLSTLNSSNYSGVFTDTSDHGDFNLIFSLNANYVSNYAVQEWTSINSLGVSLQDTALSLVVNKLDSVSVSGSFSYSDIIEYSTVVVGHYFAVPIGNQSFSTEINSNTIRSTVYFWSSQYIGHH